MISRILKSILNRDDDASGLKDEDFGTFKNNYKLGIYVSSEPYEPEDMFAYYTWDYDIKVAFWYLIDVFEEIDESISLSDFEFTVFFKILDSENNTIDSYKMSKKEIEDDIVKAQDRYEEFIKPYIITNVENGKN